MNNVQDIKIPVGVAIRVDDVGWFEGADDRHLGRPSRSGLPRRHHVNDILTLAAIGKGLGTKVLCNLVLGEWDFNNRLRGVPHVTWDERGWDAASVVEKNRDFFEGAFHALEDSEFLEYGMHGLMHGYYIDGKLHDEKYLYPFTRKNEKGQYVRDPLPADEFDRQIELFFQIYNDWGFKKKIKVWEAGNGCYGTPDDDYNREFAKILYKHGIRVWEWGAWPQDVAVRENMIFINSSLGFVSAWNAFDVDPTLIPNCFESGRRPGIVPNICGHLTNFIRFQPEKNSEYVPAWIDYFRRVTSPFGAMLARDNEESASQSLYSAFATVDSIDGGYRIDLAPVDAVRTDLVEDEFYVALRDRSLPKACLGGTISLHETRPDHVIYKIVRNGASAVTISM